MKTSRIAARVLGLIFLATGCFLTLQAQQSASSANNPRTAESGNEK